MFAIRDDDICFFTDADILKSIYSDVLGRIPLSLAIIPFSTCLHGTLNPYSLTKKQITKFQNTRKPLEDNKPLVRWLRKHIRQKNVECMLHGYTHEYRSEKGEYGWKDKETLIRETMKGKAYLEKLLSTQIHTFVPPSNALSKDGCTAIRKAGLNISGCMGLYGDRPFSLDYIKAWSIRWTYWLVKKQAFPLPLSYGGHTELRAYSLTPRTDQKIFWRQFQTNMTHKLPFVLSTHHWEVEKTKSLKDMLKKVCNEVLKKNYPSGFVKNLMLP